MSWEDREKQEIELDEGRRNKAYKDTMGNWTIGIGHFLGPNNIYAGTTWTDEQIDSHYETDFEEAEAGAEKAFPAFAGLDGPRKGALVNMSFQMGGTTLGTFRTFLNYLDLGRYKEAALDLMNTAYARQAPERAKRIAYRIQNGDYATRA